MRHLAVTAAALGMLALTLTPALAQEDSTARLLRLDELSAPVPGAGPVILRGSAIGRKPASAARPSAAGWEVAAGRRLWLVDPETKELRTCAWRDTSTVDVEEIRCMSGTFGRYRRTFGPAFQP
jgi:hypothetical protein